MPELPEVETTVKGLNILIGLKVYKVKIHTKKLRYIIPKSIIKILFKLLFRLIFCLNIF